MLRNLPGKTVLKIFFAPILGSFRVVGSARASAYLKCMRGSSSGTHVSASSEGDEEPGGTAHASYLRR